MPQPCVENGSQAEGVSPSHDAGQGYQAAEADFPESSVLTQQPDVVNKTSSPRQDTITRYPTNPLRPINPENRRKITRRTSVCAPSLRFFSVVITPDPQGATDNPNPKLKVTIINAS